jgi:hypothetical protein
VKQGTITLLMARMRKNPQMSSSLKKVCPTCMVNMILLYKKLSERSKINKSAPIALLKLNLKALFKAMASLSTLTATSRPSTL